MPASVQLAGQIRDIGRVQSVEQGRTVSGAHFDWQAGLGDEAMQCVLHQRQFQGAKGDTITANAKPFGGAAEMHAALEFLLYTHANIGDID